MRMASVVVFPDWRGYRTTIRLWSSARSFDWYETGWKFSHSAANFVGSAGTGSSAAVDVGTLRSCASRSVFLPFLISLSNLVFELLNEVGQLVQLWLKVRAVVTFQDGFTNPS